AAPQAPGLLPGPSHGRGAGRLGALPPDQLAADRGEHRLHAGGVAGVSPPRRPERLRGAAGLQSRRQALDEDRGATAPRRLAMPLSEPRPSALLGSSTA